VILIGVLFVVPIYYIARSKGYNGGLWGTVAAVLALSGMWAGAWVPVPGIGILEILLPAATLGLIWIMAPKPGAPGKAYLKITFPCSECGKSVTFKREQEGRAQLCPECGELISVPMDEHSPSPTRDTREKPPRTDGAVCLESFGLPDPAIQLVALLKANGINALFEGDDAGGTLPNVAVTTGYRVMIDVRQWEAAVAVMENQGEPLPDEDDEQVQPPDAEIPGRE